jgi:uncharacterized protein YjiS (DUF1127 family)
MGMFTDQYMQLQEIKRQGFNPTKELYGERMKGLGMSTPPSSSKVRVGTSSTSASDIVAKRASLSRSQADALIGELRKYDTDEREATGSSRSFFLHKDGGVKLKSDIVKKALSNPVGVEQEALNKIKSLGDDTYVAPDVPNVTGLPERYYEKGADAYDALRNTVRTDKTLESSVVQRLIKQGRSNLRNTIEQQLSDEALNRIGITRQQALDIIPTD